MHDCTIHGAHEKTVHCSQQNSMFDSPTRSARNSPCMQSRRCRRKTAIFRICVRASNPVHSYDIVSLLAAVSRSAGALLTCLARMRQEGPCWRCTLLQRSCESEFWSESQRRCAPPSRCWRTPHPRRCPRLASSGSGWRIPSRALPLCNVPCLTLA